MNSKSKNHNSIIFLTTLSVYLGLVLVGGSSLVLTHSALTKNFDIQNEIEVKDDLDTNPDSEEIENFSKIDFPTLFAELLEEIKNAVEAKKISLLLQTDFYVGTNYSRSPNSGGGSISSNVSNQDLSLIIQNAINQKFQPKAFELADYDGDFKHVKTSVATNDTDLTLQISFSKSAAEQYAEFLNRDFSSAAVTAKDNLLKQVYENTKATTENNQVFIVTRLPRAAIDALLAKNEW